MELPKELEEMVFEDPAVKNGIKPSELNTGACQEPPVKDRWHGNATSRKSSDFR